MTVPSAEGFLILKTIAIAETEKEKKHTPVKKIVPTIMPITRWLTLLSSDSTKQAKKSRCQTNRAWN
ncbi:MAG: hypothetical protein C5S38_00490 [Candidatus Methanophagaceae archaeon]|nr:MAG: hypothetical protein C5S38_00490 [Methanophagales archaeon]